MRKTEKIKHYLGMPLGTASHKLRKNLLFHFAKKLGVDVCYRCNGKIKTVEEFSIEHKISWLNGDNPKALFFDLENNIGFSHLKCNVNASKKQRRHKNNKYGFKGVYYDKTKNKPYFAHIWNGEKYIKSKGFATAKEAGIKYKEMESMMPQ